MYLRVSCKKVVEIILLSDILMAEGKIEEAFKNYNNVIQYKTNY